LTGVNWAVHSAHGTVTLSPTPIKTSPEAGTQGWQEMGRADKHLRGAAPHLWGARGAEPRSMGAAPPAWILEQGGWELAQQFTACCNAFKVPVTNCPKGQMDNDASMFLPLSVSRDHAKIVICRIRSFPKRRTKSPD
jgi:hypothetical protein